MKGFQHIDWQAKPSDPLAPEEILGKLGADAVQYSVWANTMLQYLEFTEEEIVLATRKALVIVANAHAADDEHDLQRLIGETEELTIDLLAEGMMQEPAPASSIPAETPREPVPNLPSGRQAQLEQFVAQLHEKIWIHFSQEFPGKCADLEDIGRAVRMAVANCVHHDGANVDLESRRGEILHDAWTMLLNACEITRAEQESDAAKSAELHAVQYKILPLEAVETTNDVWQKIEERLCEYMKKWAMDNRNSHLHPQKRWVLSHADQCDIAPCFKKETNGSLSLQISICRIRERKLPKSKQVLDPQISEWTVDDDVTRTLLESISPNERLHVCAVAFAKKLHYFSGFRNDSLLKGNLEQAEKYLNHMQQTRLDYYPQMQAFLLQEMHGQPAGLQPKNKGTMEAL